jgi:serine/threonine protein kinase
LIYSEQTAGLMDKTEAIRFYAANVIIALEHMHSKDVAYRNLKPENILIDKSGYLVLVGLGLAKRIPYVAPGEDLKYYKAFTICGTAEYLAPEMVSVLLFTTLI